MSGVTAKDIAKKLGISTASVSVALNGKPGVSQATRNKILAAAAEMGYYDQKNASAGGKLLCFLIYVDQVVGIAQESTFYTFVLKGIEAQAKQLGYRVLIRYYYANRDFAEQLSDILGDLAGLLILGTDLTAARKAQLAPLIDGTDFPFPVVMIDNFLCSGCVDCVGNDNHLRARQRVSNFDDREKGIHAALAEQLPDAARSLEIIDVDIAADRAYQDLDRWLEGRTALPQALFAENDVVAAAAIRALTARGIRVPQDISVMGFDDIPLCEMVEPTITTVHSFKETLGREAVTLLHRRISSGQSAAQIQASGVMKVSLSTRIVARKSVAPPR